MRLPDLSELLGRLNLGSLMKRLFSHGGMSLGGSDAKGGGQQSRGLLDRLLGRQPENQPRYKTSTPPAASLMKGAGKAALLSPPPKSFSTSKGSQYSVAGQSTTRTKSPHVGHEANDVGQKKPSEITYYVTPKEAERLGMHGGLMGQKTIIIQGGQAYPAFWNEQQKKWGMSATDRQSPIKLHSTPSVGLAPIELWQGKESQFAPEGREYGKWHAGNEITNIEYESSASQLSSVVQGSMAASREPVASNVNIGSLIQWTAGGVDQFSEPRPVNWISDDRKFVRVEGSRAGIPSHQVTVVNGQGAGNQPPPSGQQAAKWWQQPPVQQTRGTPSGKSEMLITRIIREKLQSVFGRPDKGQSRRARPQVARHRPQRATTATPAPAAVTRGSSSAGPEESVRATGGTSLHQHFANFFGHRSGWTGQPAARSAPHRRGSTATPEASEVLRETAGAAADAPRRRQSKKSKRLDSLQTALDIAGIFDPTPIVDGINAVVSLTRAAYEPSRREEHLENAAISGVSMVPGIGDLAKIRKFSRGSAATAGRATGRTAGPSSFSSLGKVLAAPKDLWTNTVGRAAFGVKERGGKMFENAAMSLYGNDVKIQPVSSADIAKRGMGDIMSGKKTSDQVKKEIEGERTLLEAKKKLGEQVKFLTGMFGKTGGVLFGVASAGVALVKGLNAMNAARLASQGELGYVSGEIAAAGNRREYAKFSRDSEMGRAIHQTHSTLTDADIRMERALQPGQAAITNILNNLTADFTQGIAQLVEIGNEVVKRLPSSDEAKRTTGKGIGVGIGGMYGPVGAVIGHDFGDRVGHAARAPAPAATPVLVPPWIQLLDQSEKDNAPRDPRKL